MNPTAKTVTISRELAENIANTLFRLERFADHTETIAVTLKELPRGSCLIDSQVEMLLDLHEDMIQIPTPDAESSAYALWSMIEEADKEAQK